MSTILKTLTLDSKIPLNPSWNLKIVGSDDFKDQEPPISKADERSSHVKTVLLWLEDNYEVNRDSCLPRCVLYVHYLDMCRRTAHAPMGAATFGKLIRQKFPMLSTRRLGTRGQSKYHYLGLAIKVSSLYNSRRHVGKGLTRFSSAGLKGQTSDKRSIKKTKTLLEGFPNIKGSHSRDFRKVELFLVVYKAHCQRILDTIVGANFGEVESFLLHFWHGMPDHLSKTLDADAISEVVAACDTIFYKKLIDILIPNSITEIPCSFNTEIINFTRNFIPWLDMCLINAPKKLADSKMNVAKTYIKLIQRQLSFLQLAQAARVILSDGNVTTKIIKDLEDLKEVLHLLGRQASVEVFTSLLDKIIFDLMKPAKQTPSKGEELNSMEFVLYWSQFISKFTEDLTLRNAESFGAIHLLTVTAMEYIFLIFKSDVARRKEDAIWDKIKPYTFVDKEIKDSAMDASKTQTIYKRGITPAEDHGQREPNVVSRTENREPSVKSLDDFQMHVVYNNMLAGRDGTDQRYMHDTSSYVNENIENTCNDSTAEDGNQKENAAYWMRNLPSLQDLVTNGNWNDHVEQGKLQTVDAFISWHNGNDNNALSYAFGDL